MLTLTRKVGEIIRIGEDIQIVVKEIRKNQVRIGVIAPRDVKIFRDEVYQNLIVESRTPSHWVSNLEDETKSPNEGEDHGSDTTRCARLAGTR